MVNIEVKLETDGGEFVDIVNTMDGLDTNPKIRVK